ncbi:MAG: TetR/AcrR family transcriptional regulator [Actinomycetota bacterium]
MNDRYHHGDLPTALRAAAAELVAERGPTGFSLREVARRAGVSHGAPAHHFGTSKGLLTSVAAEGFETLSAAFDEAIASADNPIDRLTAMGKAYVRIAIENPGHFGVMCSHELIHAEDDEYTSHASRAYLQLIELITEIRDTLNPDLDIDAAATMTWSAVHGLAALSPNLDDVADKTDTTVEPLDQMIEKFTEMFINGFAARPR